MTTPQGVTLTDASSAGHASASPQKDSAAEKESSQNVGTPLSGIIKARRKSKMQKETERSRKSSAGGGEVSVAVDAHHEHGGPTPLGSVASGSVCFFLYFFFCIVFSAVIYIFN